MIFPSLEFLKRNDKIGGGVLPFKKTQVPFVLKKFTDLSILFDNFFEKYTLVLLVK
jgi:hypothetical protein